MIQFRPGVEVGKPDTLSQRPDYWPLKGEGDPVTHNKFTFLKPEQVEELQNNEPLSQVNYMMCAVVAQSLNINEDLSSAISTALPMDPDIRPHLEQL